MKVTAPRLQTSDFRLQTCGSPLHRRRVALAMFHGNELGQDADGDLLRRHRADVEADRRVDALQGDSGVPIGYQRVVDARDLRAAADQAEIAQLPRREGAQRLEVVGVATRDDDGVSVRGEADAS